MNRLTRAGIAVVLLVGVLWSGGVAEAGYFIRPVTVCVDASSGVVRLVASSSKCVGGTQSWSASQPAPLLCWNASSLDPQAGTRKVSVAPSSGCTAPLQLVPVDKVSLLCAGGEFGVLRWPVTGSCRSGATPIRVRSAATPTTVATTTPTTTPPTAVVVPSVSLSATTIQGDTYPKAVTVTANVAGTVYFAEGDFVVRTVVDITSALSHRWAKGTVTSANTPTSILIDVDAVTNGYYRVFVANSQGVLSAPATNIVTISVTRASAATTTTTVALTCAQGGVCAVGDTGPGGGVVFYVALSNFTSTGSACNTACKYMEAAPRGWIVSSAPAGQTNCVIVGSSTVDPKCAWSGNTSYAISTTSALIGKGHANTTAMIAQPFGGNDVGKAATVSHAYQGGGKTDWFLPSKDELNQMCKWQRGVDWISDATVCRGGVLNSGRGASGFSGDVYWTSTEDAQYDSWFQYFNNGLQGNSYNTRKRSEFYVRPARAF